MMVTTKTCKKSVHSTKDPEYSAKHMNPTAQSYMNPNENVEPMAMPPMNPTRGL